MDKANVAEWILRRVVNSERASELVGDRLEVSSSSGPLRFWLYIAWLVFVFSWRTLAGLVAAAFVGIFFAFYPAAWVWTRLDFGGLSLLARSTWMNFALHSVLLWAEAGFCVVRFGPRNELSKLSVTAALLCTVTASIGWLPHASNILVTTAICIVLFYLTNAIRRRVLGVWVVALSLGWLTAHALLQIHMGPTKWSLLLAVVLVPVVQGGVSLFLLRRSSVCELVELGWLVLSVTTDAHEEIFTFPLIAMKLR